MSPANVTDASASATLEEIEVEVEMDGFRGGEQAPRPLPPVVVPPRDSSPPETHEAHQRRRVLDHLLGMARQYARNGSLRQAIELYFEVLADHDGTAQAAEAEDHLLAIAQLYEDQGELRLARGVYERLLKVS